MTHTIRVDLTETEIQLLRKSAALACRRPQEQARYLLRSLLLRDQSTNANSDVNIRQDSHVAVAA